MLLSLRDLLAFALMMFKNYLFSNLEWPALSSLFSAVSTHTTSENRRKVFVLRH
jgi:hypothetical protein